MINGNNKKYKNKGSAIESISKKESSYVMSIPEIKPKKEKINYDKVLQGKTLQIYWYILTHHRAGVREIQRSLNLASPGTVAYQIKKLLDAGIISKDEKDDKYHVNEEVKIGVLRFYTRIGFFMIPRFSLYLIINILGLTGYLIFAFVYGDTFIANPVSLVLLLFLVFWTLICIFESIKLWKIKPTKI